jgi:serine/threonine protein kinase
MVREALKARKFEIGDFEFKATVGTGTFGRVRLVLIPDLGTDLRHPFALKIMKKSEIIRLKQVEHVKQEKSIMSMVEHPFVVNLLGTFQDERRLCMLMEYVCGGELFSYLRQEGRLPNEHGRFYAAEITCAFEYLHSLNVVYRDLKPENLLVDHHGHTKITDFGFAKVVEGRTWTLCGTPEYLAPEIIQSKGHGKGADWWALGILIFEMLAGYPPFTDDNPFGIYQKVLAGKIAFPRHFDVKAKDLLKKLLTSDRTKRLGCLRAGAEDVKKHKWYKEVNWAVVPKRGLTPSFVPSVSGLDDTSMFDAYAESTESSAQVPREAEQAQFEGF